MEKKSVDGIVMYKLFNSPPLILIIAAFLLSLL